ncbi:unnamed protein product [Effrenium voratum]|nr:unnamed protein product [Effrenium voratum]
MCYVSLDASNASLLRFLQRQNLCEEARQSRLELLEASTTPSGRPVLCERSLQLAAKSPRTPSPSRAVSPALKECRFTPRITALARQRHARSASELGPGDQRRREERAKRRKEERDRKEAGRYDFQPSVNSYQNIGSRLRVLEEPDTLLDRITRSREAALRNARSQRKEEIYSFRPEGVQPAPALVQRMAKSHRALREMREKENRSKAKPRPAWQ